MVGESVLHVSQGTMTSIIAYWLNNRMLGPAMVDVQVLDVSEDIENPGTFHITFKDKK